MRKNRTIGAASTLKQGPSIDLDVCTNTSDLIEEQKLNSVSKDHEEKITTIIYT